MLTLAFFIIGLSSIVAGVAMVYPPAAFIVGGAFAVSLSVGYERGQKP